MTHDNSGQEASACRGQDRQELLRAMSAAEYELGSPYAQEKVRREHDYRKGRRKHLAPRIVWHPQDIVGAGVDRGCLVAMGEP